MYSGPPPPQPPRPHFLDRDLRHSITGRTYPDAYHAPPSNGQRTVILRDGPSATEGLVSARAPHDRAPFHERLGPPPRTLVAGPNGGLTRVVKNLNGEFGGGGGGVASAAAAAAASSGQSFSIRGNAAAVVEIVNLHPEASEADLKVG